MSCCYTLDLQNTHDDDALSTHTLKIMAVIIQDDASHTHPHTEHAHTQREGGEREKERVCVGGKGERESGRKGGER